MDFLFQRLNIFPKDLRRIWNFEVSQLLLISPAPQVENYLHELPRSPPPLQIAPEEPVCGWGPSASTGEEVGEALDVLPENHGERGGCADSPTAASWNCSAGLANEWYFSKVIQSCYNIPAPSPAELPVRQTRKFPEPCIPEQSST